MDMWKPLIHGAAAGAVGTAVLNTVTYMDMVVRDRPSSDVPAETAERATDLVGVTLAPEGEDGAATPGQNRKQGVGALMGYLSGFGVGAAFGLLRAGVLAGVPRPVAGVGVAAAATVATVVPYSALGVSDPRDWPAEGWAADIIPHLCYGWATVAAFDALHRADSR